MCGVRETEAKFLDGPQEDMPREEVIVVCPRTSKPEESLVEMDAWARPAALLASGYNMEQVVKFSKLDQPGLSLSHCLSLFVCSSCSHRARSVLLSIARLQHAFTSAVEAATFTTFQAPHIWVAWLAVFVPHYRISIVNGPATQ